MTPGPNEPLPSAAVTRHLTGNSMDIVAFVDELMGLARTYDVIAGRALDDQRVELRFGADREVVALPGAKSIVRMVCARLAAQLDHDPYGGSSTTRWRGGHLSVVTENNLQAPQRFELRWTR